MCNPQRWLCVAAKTHWNHFHTFTLVYTSAISLNKSYLYIANCMKLIKLQFPTPFLNAGKEMLILFV